MKDLSINSTGLRDFSLRVKVMSSEHDATMAQSMTNICSFIDEISHFLL